MKKKQSMPNNKEKSITYALKSFVIISFSIVEPREDITKEFNVQKLKIGFNIDFAYNIDLNIFQIILGVIYRYELNDNDESLLKLSLMSEFTITDISTVLEIDGDNFKMPDDILTTFVSLTYSSARGIIFAKTQGSFLNQFVLPVIDPKELLDFKFKQQNSGQ